MFTDYEGETIIFKQKTNISNKVDSEIQTEEDKTEFFDEECQVIIRKEISTQTNLKEMITNENVIFDEKKLEVFLSKAMPTINEALNSRYDENIELFEEEESEEYFSNLLMKITCISSKSDKNLKISDVCWNSTGNTLAISYSIDNHIGPCSHSGKIDFFKFSNISESKTFKEKITIETNSCIKSIDSHPKYPSIFTFSSFIGEIYLIDVSENKDVDQIQCISKIDSYFHKECVNLVKWIKYEDENYYILSLSEEGRLLLWNPEDKLTYPSLGFSLKFKIGKNSFPINPISMGVDLFETFNFVIGTLDGNIYKCSFAKPDENIHEYIFSQSSGTVWRRAVRQLISNMSDNDVIEMKNYMDKFCKDKNIMDLNVDEFFKLKPNVAKLYKNALKSNFEKHISMVTSVEFSPFFKNLFLTSSFDGSLRIYHQSLHGSKYILSQNLNSEYYTTATWSPFKPGLIISGTSNGKICFLKLSKHSIKILYEVERKIENSIITYPVRKIKCNPFLQNIVSICYEDGIMEIIKLSDDLCYSKHDEIANFNKILSYLIN